MGLSAESEVGEVQESPILVEADESGLAIISFNRPQQLNAWSQPFMVALHAALQQVLRPGSGTRVLVLRGLGRAFGAGGDMSLFVGQRTPHDVHVRYHAVQGSYQLLHETEVVSIAALHGACVGSSLVLAGCCDLRIADEDTSLLLPEVNMGMLPGIGVAHMRHSMCDRLLRRLILTGDPCDAATAERDGFISELTPNGRSLGRALELARQLLTKPGQALGKARRTAWLVRNAPPADAIDFELVANQALLDSGEPRLRAQAFLNSKR